MTEPLKDRCRGRWPSILSNLGVPAAYLTGKHGPCPMCQGKDRYRFDNKEGSGSYICSHCGAGDGVKLLMTLKGWDFKEAARSIEEVLGIASETPIKSARSEDEKRQAMNKVWKSSAPISDADPVGIYLRRRTGIRNFPVCLRSHPRLRYHDEAKPSFHPAMVAMLHDAHGKPAILHRTYLTRDGRKADVENPRRIMNGSIPKGCAVRLFQFNAASSLGIAEGIETAISAAKLFKVPCWAAINAAMLTNWIPPEGVQEIIVFGDCDATFTGQRAAYNLAFRLREKGLTVRVEIPRIIGQDWNDVLQEQFDGAPA